MVQVFVLNTIIGNRLKRKGKKLHVAFVESIAVSTEKTKVMSFRRGGKRRKGATSWKFWGNTTVKAGALYGVEIWGWQRREIIEGVQLRFVKTCLGFPKYTIDYVCKMEEGRREIEVDALRRAVGFL